MAKKNRNRNGRIRSVVEPFSPRQINRETNARVRLEFGDVGRALQGDLRANAQSQRNTNAWFQQYQNTMAGLRREQDRANAGLRDRMGQGATALGSQGAARSDAVQSDQDRSASIRGAIADTGARATESAAESQRQALMGLARDRADQMGESSQSRLRQVNAAAELGRQADIRGIRNEALETRAKIRDLGRDKGASRIKNRSDIIRGERDFSIQNRTLNANIADDRADNALDRQREARLAREAASGGSGSGGGGGGGRGPSPQKVRQATSWLRSSVRKESGGVGWMDVASRPQFYVDLLINRNVPERVARVAVRRYIRRNKQRVTNNTPNSSGAGRPGSNTG